MSILNPKITESVFGDILVVEDNTASMKLLVGILVTAGYTARPALDGELALRSVKTKRPDLIMLDFQLPGMNGLEVCRRLKADPETADIPVIFISSISSSELKVKSLGTGAVDYVTKPIDESEVLARIASHLDKYRLQQQLVKQARELALQQEHLEEQVARRTSELNATLAEKEILLREIHHRVKNNMQVIVSLLRLHSRRTEDDQVHHVFNECRNRINAMALIHEALYESQNIDQVDFSSYLNKLCRHLNQAYCPSCQRIKVSVSSGYICLGMDQGIAMGMIVCELVSNAFKHAFHQNPEGIVSLNLSQSTGNEIQLTVEDDGSGLPEEISITKPVSLGFDLTVSAVRGELGGTIEVERNKGTKYTIRFKGKDMVEEVTP